MPKISASSTAFSIPSVDHEGPSSKIGLKDKKERTILWGEMIDFELSFYSHRHHVLSASNLAVSFWYHSYTFVDLSTRSLLLHMPYIHGRFRAVSDISFY